MAGVWGVHSDRPDLHVEENGVVAIGWGEVGDLRQIGPDREAIKAKIAYTYPDAKKGSIPATAGILYRFAFEVEVGDLIIYPYKPDRTIHFGRVTGDYFFDETVGTENHPNRRSVQWFRLSVPRPTFSQGALSEISAWTTLFKVARHADEFESYLNGEPATPEPIATEVATDVVDETSHDEDALVASRVDEYTRDFVIKTLLNIGPYEFEGFVAGLLEAMGYRATVTQASGDGGVDVLASRDPLGLGPPVIKVQCKRTAGVIGAPDVQKLLGTLVGSQQGLFVTLGGYSPAAMQEARTKHDIKLINGDDLTDMVFEYYEKLEDRWKRVLPLRSVFAVEGGVA